MRLPCQSGQVLAFAALLGLTLLGAHASAAGEQVVAAVSANDVAALEMLSKSAATAQQRALAAGALLALRHQDPKAIATLMPVPRSGARRIVRAAAYLVLSDIYQRDQRYRECYSAVRSASDMSAKSVHLDYRQTMAVCKTLADAKHMRLVRETPGSLPITGKRAGVIRVPVKIDGQAHGAMIDTGASFSTISASVAKRSGVQLLGGPLSVGSSTKRAVAMRLGIAKRLQFGNAVFKNVVFIVVADSDWGMPRSFQISVIIGMSVLEELGRLEFVSSGSPALLYDVPAGRPAGHAGGQSNMLLWGLEPLVLVHVPGAANPLRMELDTGSNITYFTKNAIADDSALLGRAKRYVWHVGGLGRIMKERRALRLPVVTFTIGGRPITMKNIVISSRTSASSDGVIGEDILRHGARWTMDFKSMTLEVSH